MTFWKLVLAIACGILAAETVNGVIYGVINEGSAFYERHRTHRIHTTDPEEKYGSALALMRGGGVSKEEVVHSYCRDVTPAVENPIRAMQLLRGCELETSDRMTRDLH